MMPDDGLDQLRAFESIFLGAVGFPGVPDHVSLWGLLIPIRRGFHQYINLRPVRLLKGVKSPLAGRGPSDIDMLIVRENNEGEYSEIGGRLYKGAPEEMAVQQAIFTRKGCDRVMRFAFEQAKKRRQHVTSATKSNGIIHSMPYWDERFAAVSREYPGIKTAQFHIDILTAHFVQHPDWFDVVVGSNLFGDILSDLGPAIAGSIGIAPGGNINPEKEYPSMFEPVHGSAPDIAGKNVANPIAQIWTGRDDARSPGPSRRGPGRGDRDREGRRGGQDRHRATSAARPAPPRPRTPSPRCSSRVLIRRYRPDDFDPVTDLWRQVPSSRLPGLPGAQGLHRRRGPRVLSASVVVVKREVWVTEDAGRPVAFMAMPGDFIDQLYVAPEHQRRGLGQALLAHARTRSPSGLRLFTFQFNANGRAFYEKNGFVVARLGVSPAPESEPDLEYHWRP
jgi:tartrate dehydrogenase